MRITREMRTAAAIRRSNGETWTAIAADLGCSDKGLAEAVRRGGPGRYVAPCGSATALERHRERREHCLACLDAENARRAAQRAREGLGVVDAAPVREVLRALLLDSGCSVPDVERGTGIARSAIYALLRNPHRRPRRATAIRLARWALSSRLWYGEELGTGIRVHVSQRPGYPRGLHLGACGAASELEATDLRDALTAASRGEELALCRNDRCLAAVRSLLDAPNSLPYLLWQAAGLPMQV